MASQKDNILFLMGGLLVGFVVAYLMFEAMATNDKLTSIFGSSVERSTSMPVTSSVCRRDPHACLWHRH